MVKKATSCCGPADKKATSCSGPAETLQSVQDYYGKVLATSNDLKTNACTADSRVPDHIQQILELLSDEVISKYYGCGMCVPEMLEGCKVLDLGCGAGRDSFILSKLVGSTGRVVGVDMTPEMLETAKRNVKVHTDKFGYSEPNIEFKQGYIERLADLDLKNNYFDCIVSNCVINLSPDKDAVLREAYRVLKPGGELYFSDVYADRRLPQELLNDKVLYGECLSGALYWNDFLSLARKNGFNDPRLVSCSQIGILSSEIKKKMGNIGFFSATYRLFKIPELECTCEVYGQAVVYKGNIKTSPEIFILDEIHKFEIGRAVSVCRNTSKMLHDTRFKEAFDFFGSGEIHYGMMMPDCNANLSRKLKKQKINGTSSCKTGC